MTFGGDFEPDHRASWWPNLPLKLRLRIASAELVIYGEEQTWRRFAWR
jgi:hypothetical protein